MSSPPPLGSVTGPLPDAPPGAPAPLLALTPPAPMAPPAAEGELPISPGKSGWGLSEHAPTASPSSHDLCQRIRIPYRVSSMGRAKRVVRQERDLRTAVGTLWRKPRHTGQIHGGVAPSDFWVSPACPLSPVAPAAGSSTAPPMPASSPVLAEAPPAPPSEVFGPLPATAPTEPALEELAPPRPTIGAEPPPVLSLPPGALDAPGRSGCGLSRQPTAKAEQASQRQCRITEPIAPCFSKNPATTQPAGQAPS
jgi:hypothetical protein